MATEFIWEDTHSKTWAWGMHAKCFLQQNPPSSEPQSRTAEQGSAAVGAKPICAVPTSAPCLVRSHRCRLLLAGTTVNILFYWESELIARKNKAISGQETSQAAVPISHQALQPAAMGLFARRWHCGHTIVPVTSPASQRSAHGCHRTDCAILQSQSICSTKHARNCFSLWSLNVILEITAHLF